MCTHFHNTCDMYTMIYNVYILDICIKSLDEIFTFRFTRYTNMIFNGKRITMYKGGKCAYGKPISVSTQLIYITKL